MLYLKSNLPMLDLEFELRFGRKPSVSHLRSFGCKCHVLKCENSDKFESYSFDGILPGYTPHDRSYCAFNLETNGGIPNFPVIS
jgi:hypothetical protein